MRKLRSLAVAAAAAVLSQAAPLTENGRFVQSPAGLIPVECYHEVPHGTVVEHAEGEHVAILPSGERRSVPKCSTKSWAAAFEANVQRRRSNIRGGSLPGRSLQLPADYKGWVQYAAAQFPSANASVGWSAFTSIFTTPAAIPEAQPDVLYLFPGLQVSAWNPTLEPGTASVKPSRPNG